MAKSLRCHLLRVALKHPHQIAWARETAAQAADQGIVLVHQCHTKSLFETVEWIVDTLEQIDHPNFGLVYEPANLEICGEDYGPRTIRRLALWIRNVYLQNQILHVPPSGLESLIVRGRCFSLGSGFRTYSIRPLGGRFC